jgi:hypothetical protein
MEETYRQVEYCENGALINISQTKSREALIYFYEDSDRFERGIVPAPLDDTS